MLVSCLGHCPQQHLPAVFWLCCCCPCPSARVLARVVQPGSVCVYCPSYGKGGQTTRLVEPTPPTQAFGTLWLPSWCCTGCKALQGALCKSRCGGGHEAHGVSSSSHFGLKSLPRGFQGCRCLCCSVPAPWLRAQRVHSRAGSSGPSAPASDTGCQHLAASCEPPWRLPLAEPQLTTIHSRHWPAHGD